MHHADCSVHAVTEHKIWLASAVDEPPVYDSEGIENVGCVVII